ncbi:MAG: hypothetical protein JSU03_10100 [Bacteroidetes bacterium]|nr:hypothetical protein [Bacteroidota bacterium]MBS1757620.1 hypothetical protein [Bacteroidota bacterium]
MRQIIILLFIVSNIQPLHAQLLVSGTVLDNSKLNFVEKVHVISTGGKLALTDSLGRYSISVNNDDSIYFFYNNRPTQKFPVRDIPNLLEFDISIHMQIPSKYNLLKEVTVYSTPYAKDSIENRETYRKAFNYSKPGFSTSISPGGVAGADLDQLINVFRFGRNKRLKSFQKRLLVEEQDKYIDYRFNKTLVKRITGLSGNSLDSFMVWYRPSYEFTITSNEVTFDQYILNASYRFKRGLLPSPAKKEEE